MYKYVIYIYILEGEKGQEINMYQIFHIPYREGKEKNIKFISLL